MEGEHEEADWKLSDFFFSTLLENDPSLAVDAEALLPFRDFPDFLGLPVDIVLSILDILLREGRQTDLKSLRCSSVYLSQLCAPFVFRAITWKRSENTRSIPSRIAPFVQVIKFYIPKKSFYTKGFGYERILPNLPNVRHIEVKSDPLQKASHPDLIEWAIGLKHLEHLKITSFWEAGGYEWDVHPYRNSFQMSLFSAILRHNPMNLLSLDLSHANLPRAGFIQLRGSAPRLKKWSMERALSTSTRELWGLCLPYAFGDSLTTLALVRCAGAHAAYIARNVVSGIFKNLARLELYAFGHHSDDKGIPHPHYTAWAMNKPALDVLIIDHSEYWELVALGSIRAKQLWLSRTNFDEAAQVMLDTHRFMGVEKMLVHKGQNYLRGYRPPPEDHVKAFEAACHAREIDLEYVPISFKRALELSTL